MNNLQRDIKEGEIVVLQKELFKPQYQALEHRLFRCNAGFGMSNRASGTAIIGEFVSDGEHARYNGYHIDAEETIKYQKQKEDEYNEAVDTLRTMLSDYDGPELPLAPKGE